MSHVDFKKSVYMPHVIIDTYTHVLHIGSDAKGILGISIQ